MLPCFNFLHPPHPDNRTTHASPACKMMTRCSSGESTDPYHLGQTLVLTCQTCAGKVGTQRKINDRNAKTSNMVLSRQRRVQSSFQGQLYTQDESDLLGSHLIFTARIQIPPGSFCAVSTFYLKN